MSNFATSAVHAGVVLVSCPVHIQVHHLGICHVLRNINNTNTLLNDNFTVCLSAFWQDFIIWLHDTTAQCEQINDEKYKYNSTEVMR